MATQKLLLLPGDGIGPEVMAEVKRVIDWLNAKGITQFETDQGLVGGSAYDAHKVSISEGDMAKAKAAAEPRRLTGAGSTAAADLPVYWPTGLNLWIRRPRFSAT